MHMWNSTGCVKCTFQWTHQYVWGNDWHYWTTRCVHEGLMRLLLSHWFSSQNVNVFIIHSSKVYACDVKLQKRQFIMWDTQGELLMCYQSWHIEHGGGCVSRTTQRWSSSGNIECEFASMLSVRIVLPSWFQHSSLSFLQYYLWYYCSASFRHQDFSPGSTFLSVLFMVRNKKFTL